MTRSTRLNQIKNSHKFRNRYVPVAAFMAFIVGFTTVASLVMPATAMAKTEKVLDCPYEVHQHSDDEHPLLDENGNLLQPSCYEVYTDEDGRQHKDLVCGMADYVIHTHDDNCYVDGKLVCTLPEIKEHKHDASCYKEEKVLVCGITDPGMLKGHVHNDSCYTENSTLTCTKPEHVHTDACYTMVEVPVPAAGDASAGMNSASAEGGAGSACFRDC